jgi:hypothetical protein
MYNGVAAPPSLLLLLLLLASAVSWTHVVDRGTRLWMLVLLS